MLAVTNTDARMDNIFTERLWRSLKYEAVYLHELSGAWGTCIAPDIVEAILDGRQPKGLKLAALLRDVPSAWEEQQKRLFAIQ